jgi:hypothetical protein
MPPRSRKLAVVEDHKLLPAVRETLAALVPVLADDTGLRKLAEQYASAIDEAQAVAIDARKLIEQCKRGDLELPRRMLNALEKYSDSTSVLGELGPKLQSALESLGASPKARAAMIGRGKKPDAPAENSASSADARRARAAQRRENSRLHSAETVDPSAP